MHSAEELLDLVIRKAPELRRAGVASIDLDEVSFSLLPPDPVLDPVSTDEDEDEASEDGSDPFFDPATFGGRVPGKTRRGGL